MKTLFKEHIQALVSNKLPEEKGDSKSAVQEFQKKKNRFSLMDKKLAISAFHTAYLKIFTVAKPIIYLRRHILRIPILRKKNKLQLSQFLKKKKLQFSQWSQVIGSLLCQMLT